MRGRCLRGTEECGAGLHGYSGERTTFKLARAATTAVSVRRMSWPREASWNPPERAETSSSTVQPPSGPMASAAVAGLAVEPALVPSNDLRIEGASPRSESMTRIWADGAANALAGL